MARTGYTNVRPTDERNRYFEAICKHLALDPQKHAGRLQAVDYALRKAAQELMPAKCEKCGIPLPQSTFPYWIDIGQSVQLCQECAKQD